MPTKRKRRRLPKMSYLQIANHMEGRIADGEWEVDEQLPSYSQLASLDEYGVSVATIARAIAILRDRRVVYGRPGAGVYVAEEE